VSKDALRRFLERHGQTELLPADIEIGEDESGRPVPMGPWTQDVASLPTLSFAVSDGLAVAVAGQPPNGLGLGVSVERVGELTPQFAATHFTRDEQAVLDSVPRSSRHEWMIRSSCARDSVVNALGRKRVESPGSVRLREIDARSGVVEVALDPELAEVLPQLADVRIVAYTLREEDYIVATTLCEVKSS
jgi:hypothetical protein